MSATQTKSSLVGAQTPASTETRPWWSRRATASAAPSTSTARCGVSGPTTNDLIDDADPGLDLSDATAWYADSDTDGFGAGPALATTCVAPSGTVDNTTDCDDTNFDVNPAATEVCNGIDDDCDTDIDDDDTSLDLSSATEWHDDADSDGYGVSTVAATTCVAASGTVANSTDCDDGDSAVNPAATEVCNGIDDDCDTDIDDDDTSLDTGTASTFYTDADTDGYGDDSSPVLACSLPSGASTDNTDCDDTEITVNPGATEVCSDGLDNNCDSLPDPCVREGDYGASDAEAQILAEASGNELGQSLAMGLDMNGDGVGDVVVGADAASPNGASFSGAAYVVFGPISGSMDAIDGARFDGEAASDYAGGAVAAAGDLDGDSFDDFVVGADFATYDSNSQAGAAYIVVGPATAASTTLLSTTTIWGGESTADHSGNAVVGNIDFDNDGSLDVLVGAYGAGSSGTYGGKVYLLSGTLTAGGSLSTAAADWEGIDSYGHFGTSVAAAGDLNSDGIDDLVVGASLADVNVSNDGVVYLFEGPAADHPTSATATRWVGETASAYAGRSVAGAGDINDDGYDDVLVGAYGDATNGSTAGAVYVLLGPASVGGSLSAADAKLLGEASGDLAGWTVAPGGDINHDGIDDFLVSAPSNNEGATDAGRAYMWFGPVSGTLDLSAADVRVAGDSTNDRTGWSFASGADVNDDGQNDVMIGSSTASYGGAALLFMGLDL